LFSTTTNVISIEKERDITRIALDLLKDVAEENRKLRSENFVLKLAQEANNKRMMKKNDMAQEIEHIRSLFFSSPHQFDEIKSLLDQLESIVMTQEKQE